MSTQGWGALAGLAVALGLVLVASWVSARRPLPVVERIRPFVPLVGGAGSAAPRQSSPSTLTTLWLLVRPSTELRVRSPRTADRRGPTGVSHSRALWVAAGGLVGLAVASVAGKGSPSVVGVMAMCLIGAVSGYLAFDQNTAARIRRRRELVDQQLPTVAELLAFAVAAGESPLSALERVSRTTAGELSAQIDGCVSAIRSGQSIDIALRSMAHDVGSPALSRFVDGLVIALERGTPLAEIMRAQAADCRADERRRLMEIAGRKDVLMLVPVVFLILPSVVLVAVYPGVATLRMVVA